MERVTDLTSAPVIGKIHLVPTVHEDWMQHSAHWPVMGPAHADGQFFEFPGEHYHIDPRFLSRELFRLAGVGDNPINAHRWLQRVPLSIGYLPPRVPVWRPRKCQRAEIPYMYGDNPRVLALKAHYTGQQAKPNRCGWVCPHQHFPMGSIAPDADGFITCPLHGLRINANTGVAA